VVAGCGGESPAPESDEEEIAAAFERYKDATASGDARALCSEVFPPRSIGGGPVPNLDQLIRDCVSGYEESGSPADPAVRRQVLGEIDVEGDRAHAPVTDGPYETAHFSRDGGQWYLRTLSAVDVKRSDPDG